MELTTLIGRIGKVTESMGPNNTPYLRIRLAVNIVKRNAATLTEWWTIFSNNVNIFDHLKEGRLILVSGRAMIDESAVALGNREGQMNAFHIELLPESNLTFQHQVAEMLGFDAPKEVSVEEILKALAEEFEVAIPQPERRSQETPRSAQRNAARAAQRGMASGPQANPPANPPAQPPAEPVVAGAGARTGRGRGGKPAAGAAGGAAPEAGAGAPPAGGQPARSGRSPRGGKPAAGGAGGGKENPDDGPPF